jgi:hypothetical protein
MVKFIWVVNSLRHFNQSAAQGLLFSSAHSLRLTLPASTHVLLVTNERREFAVYEPGRAKEIVNYWLERCGLPLLDRSKLFNEVILCQTTADSLSDELADSVLQLAVKSSFPGEPPPVLVFNNSYYSSSLFSRAVYGGHFTVFMSMAPMKEYDCRADVITHSQVESIIRLKSSDKTRYLIPARYPYFYGEKGLSRDGRRPKDGCLNILTSGENILSRLSAEDFLDVMLPVLNSHALCRWLIVGVSQESVIAFVRGCGFSEKVAELINSKRILFYSRVEEFFEFIELNVDIYFKGSHAGGATTAAAAINRGVPVVDYVYSDCRVYLSEKTLISTPAEARELIERLLLSERFRAGFAARQKALLVLNNEGMWSRELTSVIRERFFGEGYFDPNRPRQLFNV